METKLILFEIFKTSHPEPFVYILTILSGTRRAETPNIKKTIEGEVMLMMVKVMTLSNQK